MFKIKYKLLMVILALSLIPQLILDQLSAQNIEKHITQRYDLVADQTTEALKRLVDSTFEEGDMQIESMSRNIQFIYNPGKNQSLEKNSQIPDLQVDENALEQLLRVTQETSSNIPNFYIGTSKGEMFIYPRSTLPAGYDPRTRSWYQNAFLNKNHSNWIGPYIDQGTKQLVLTVSKFYQYKENEGVVGIDIEMSALRDMIGNSDLGKMGEVFLVNDQGEIILHQDANFEGMNLKFTRYYEDHIQKSIDLGAYEGKLYRFKSLPIRDNIYAVTVVNREEIKAEINHELWRNRVIPFLFAGICIFVAFVMADRLTKPVYKLIEAMKRTELGEYHDYVQATSSDEIALLTHEYNQMTQGLKNAHEEMTALYEELRASEETLQDQYDELIRNRDQIRDSEMRYKTIFDMSNEGLWEQINHEEIRLLSPHWFKPYFIDQDEITQQEWLDLIHPDDIERFNTAIENHRKGVTPYFHEIYRVRSLQGVYKIIESKGKIMIHRHARFSESSVVESLIASHLDITEQKRNEDEVLRMAYFDPVTGLANRRNYERELRQTLDQHRWGYIVYMDIEDFKRMNEDQGYKHGDAVLKDLARRINEQFKDAFAARVAGDEFALILGEHTNENDLSLILEQFSKDRCCTSEGLNYKLHTVYCKFPGEGKSVEDLYMTLLAKLKKEKEERG